MREKEREREREKEREGERKRCQTKREVGLRERRGMERQKERNEKVI